MILMLFISLCVHTLAIDLPQYFPRCSRNDPLIGKCIANAANELRFYVKDGINEIGIPSFDPVLLKFSYFSKQKEVELAGQTWDYYVHDLYKYNITELRFFPEDVLLEGKVHFGRLPASSYYTLNAVFGMLPVEGDGMLWGTIGPIRVDFKFRGKRIHKGRVEYCKLENVKLKLTMDDVDVNFSGLKTDDDSIGDINEIFKSNSKMLAKAAEPVYEKVFQKYVARYLEWFLEEIPYSTLFI
ncbi:hypothetical protein FQR65_LT08334 [Abscondita terminalis]|nr:hypothetical protein FQR65_LT08334 [Abscondita terminalis]